MIDLSLMRGIHVDPAGRSARATGWRHLERAEPRNAIARPCRDRWRDSTTGIAGLTLGGGSAG